MTKLDLALVELNMKFAAAVEYAMNHDHGIDADEWAIAKLQDDIAHVSALAGKTVLFDSNYSRTWGFHPCGIYKDLNEMQDVAQIVDGGF